jgi:hypothetical protein
MTVDPDGNLRHAALREIDEQIRRRQKGEADPTGEPAAPSSALAERDVEEAERERKMDLVQAAMADHSKRQERDVKGLLTAVSAQTGVPLEQLLEVGPLRADAASLMHRARQIGGR